MNGGDIGSIQLLQGHQQPADPQPPLASVYRSCTPLRQDRIRHVGSLAKLHLLQTSECQLQTLADSRPQLLCSGIGVGDHQQGFQRMPCLRDQAQAEVSQSEGLPGAGTGFQQAKTRFQRVGVGIKTLGHGAILNRLQRRVAGWWC